MLAVFEHLGDGARRNAAAGYAAMLRSGGRVVLTVPYQPDRISHFLARLGIVAGMTMHEHHASTCG